MKLRNLRYLDIFTVFSMEDEHSKGRCVMLSSAILSTMVSYLAMSGTLYTAFLTANNFSIVDTGIIGFIPSITAVLCLFSPLLLERFKKRRAVLVIARIFYYMINLVGITLVTSFVKDQSAKLFWFGVVLFCSHAFNALTSSGWTVWHLNFIPDNVRARYFSYQQIITSLLSGLVLLATGLIADSIRGTDHEMTVLIILRIVGAVLAITEIVILALPKEYPYPSTGEKIRISNTFRYPLRAKKYMLTVMLILVWTFGANIPATWTYYLMNSIQIKVTTINVIDFVYSLFLIVLSPFARRMLSRFSWFKTFALCAVINAGITLAYAIGIRSIAAPTAFFIAIRLMQHAISVPLNLSYANFAYINMPKENQTYFLSFYLLVCNVVAFLGQMTGTLLLQAIGSNTITLLGMTLEAPAILVLIQVFFQLVVCVMIFTMEKTLTPKTDD